LDFESNNYLVVGMENASYPITNNGVSFSDHVAELIDYPYVNFVLVSYDEKSLEEFSNSLKNVNELINTNITEYLNKLKLDQKLTKLLNDNINTVYFDFTENEREALDELLRLPFYHGIVEEITEVKYL